MNPVVEDLMRRTHALSDQTAELRSIVKLLGAASEEPFDPDGDWKGQGWILNARKWISLIKACQAAKHNPQCAAAAAQDARKAFNTLVDLRELALQHPHEYDRFIEESAHVVDEARELIGPSGDPTR